MVNIYHKMPSEGFFGAVFTTVDKALNWFRLSSVWYFSSVWPVAALNLCRPAGRGLTLIE